MPIKKLITIFCLSIILFGCIILGISCYSDYRIGFKKVCVAKHKLSQRSEITSEDLEAILVPKDYLNSDVCQDKKAIVGHYVKLNHSIPKGSFFYAGALEESTEIKDYAHTFLKAKEASFDLNIAEIKANPANLNVGMLVDLYLTIDINDLLISDILIENARIIGLYDYDNQAIKDFDTKTSVKTITLAINKEAITTLNKALLLGDVALVVNQGTYDTNKKPRLVKDTDLFTYLD